MEQLLRQRAESIWTAAIRSVLPDEAVRRALEHFHPQGRVFLVAAGKAAWQMAHAALAVLGRVDAGIVITKYGHVRGPLPGVTCCEAGHPVPDDNSFAATQRALALVSGLRADDTVLFLLSGGLTAAYMTKLFVAIFVSSRAVGQRPALKDYMSPGTHAALSVGAALLLVLGLTPGLTMEPLAQWAGRFLRADPGHSVHYFAWVNLKGACISLAIGAAVYLLVVRGLLMRREADGMVYLDRWPARLDLENLVYPRHLCAEAGRELRHIRTETPPFPNGRDLLL